MQSTPCTDAGFDAPLHLFLKSHTLAHHRALERSLLARTLLAPGLTVPLFGAVLCPWFSAWQVLEHLLVQHCPTHVAPANRPALRSHLALAGLTHLGLSTALADAESIMPAPPWMEDGGWYGLAYVLQGAALGGEVIGRHLQRTLPHHAHAAMGFFVTSRAADWKPWCQWLDTQAVTPAQRLAAAQAAADTFVFLEGCFASFDVFTTPEST